LNPERQETDSEIAPRLDALAVDVFRVGLEVDPGVVLNRKIRAVAAEDAGEVVRA
jgi:hypothetical protein